jgi:hypothetical protein
LECQIQHLGIKEERQNYTVPVITQRLALKLQKDYNLPKKRRKNGLPEKLPKLPRSKAHKIGHRGSSIRTIRKIRAIK